MASNKNVDKYDRPSNYWSKRYRRIALKTAKKNMRFNFGKDKNFYYKIPSYYDLKIIYFFPIIGWFISLFSACKAYGIIRSTTIFNKKLYAYFKSKIIFSGLIHFFNGPFAMIVILFFCPLFVVDRNQYFELYSQLGKIPFNDFVTQFVNLVLVPMFSSDAWWKTIIVCSVFSMANVASILTYLAINWKRDNYVRLFLLEDDLKMKLTQFIKDI